MMFQLKKKIGEGGHGSVWTVKEACRKRERDVAKPHDYVAKLFTSRSCHDWELYGNAIVYDALDSDTCSDVLKLNTCLIEASKQTTTALNTNCIEDETSDDNKKAKVRVIMYRHVHGVTLDGHDLHAQRQAFASPTEFLVWARRLLHVVNAFHSNAIIHNDIKPGNLMIENTHPVLLDFGISVPLDRTKDIREENTTELFMDPGTLCYRKAQKRKKGITVFEAHRQLRRKWFDYPWKQLDELVRRRLDCVSYPAYVHKVRADAKPVLPETRDIYGVGVSLLQISVQTFGYIVPCIESLIVACIRVADDAFRSCDEVIAHIDLDAPSSNCGNVP